jgi:iturin family lipopeptide synthetase A
MTNGKLGKESVQDIFELSATQKGMLFHYLEDVNSNLYNVQLSFKIAGDLDIARLKEAIERTQLHNEVLRSVFRWQEANRPLQFILKTCAFDFRVRQLSSHLDESREDIIRQLTEEDLNERFDITQLPLRFTVIELSGQSFVLTITYHHLLLDGWSNAILLKEIFYNYQQLMSGCTPMTPLKPAYGEVRKKMLTGTPSARIDEFWAKYLKDYQIVSLFPERVSVPGGKRRSKKIKISSPIENIERFTRQYNVTKASVIYAAYGILLQRYCNTSDVVFGTTVSNRDADIAGIEHVMGNFIDTIPVRSSAHGTLAEIVTGMQTDLIERHDYNKTSYATIKRILNLKPSEDLFDSVIVIENYPIDKNVFNAGMGLAIQMTSFYESIDIPLLVTVFVTGELVIEFSFDEMKVDSAFVRSLSGHLLNIIEAVVTHPDQRSETLHILGQEEKDLLIYKFNDTRATDSDDETIISLFEKQVAKTPDKIALIDRHHTLTYRELNSKSNDLAGRLLQKGVIPGDIIGVMMPRRQEMLIGILSVLKLGCAYVPIDPDYPAPRIDYMLKDSDLSLLLTTRSLENACSQISPNVTIYTVAAEELAETGSPDLCISFPSTSLAYLIYTSGTTGNPKGIMIEHGNVVNYVKGVTDSVEIGLYHSILCLTTVCFDIFITETIVPLLNGLKIVLADSADQKDPYALAAMIIKHEVDLMQITPSHLNLLLNGGQVGFEKCLKAILIGGEGWPYELLLKLRSKYTGKVYNMYGPTETTVWSAIQDITDRPSIDIGNPIRNTSLYILDSRRNLMPIGVTGELYIGGDGLARGYWKNDDLTKEKFTGDPFIAGQKIYKTGDLAFRQQDGSIKLLGRLDNQVKVRGFRIELAEIEAHLVSYEFVKETAVVVHEMGGDKSIVAYYTSEREIKLDEFKGHVAGKLPDYMIPSYFVRLERLPLTPNGKLDRKALPKPEIHGQTDDTEPSNETERKLITIWSELLGHQNISVNMNFFDIGGDSLKLIAASNMIRKEFARSLTINDLFEYPTITRLAGFLNRNGEIKKQEYKEKSGDGSDIAIIGLACRFPGASDSEEFWDLLQHGKESITRKESPANSSLVYAKGFLQEYDCFDPAFFNYTPAEAGTMDPQMRVFHECVYEALQNSGYAPSQYEGRIGVYAGATANPYYNLSVSDNPSEDWAEKWDEITYMDKDFLCNRVSYKLNLKGPSVNISTACSTSLVAVDKACGEIVAGKCDIAIAGGVSITLHDEKGYFYQKGMILSPDGKCKAFDENSSGTVGGNGVGVVVLKRMNRALEDGDFIHAVIKGTATNNDGCDKVGFTAPSINGQSKVIEMALENAGIRPESISCIEAHGTGTALGDPVEIAALTKAFNSNKRQFCAIGSVKTNIGHLDAAAGIAGLIKMVLALKHKQIPPSLHFKKPNPNIDFVNSPFFVNAALSDWPDGGSPRRAGVSSFGIGGTNVHVILEEPPERKAASESRSYQLLPFSAKSPAALERYIRKFAKFLETGTREALADIAFTLQSGRSPFLYRKVIVCKDNGEGGPILLEDLTDKEPNTIPDGSRPTVALMFSGQGSQYKNMCRDLYNTEAAFRTEVDTCSAIIKGICGKEILPVIFPSGDQTGAADIDDTEFAQPALFIIEYALARLLIKWGISPDILIGHSIGEYVAACISGVFSLDQALRLVVKRGELMQKTTRGKMLSISISSKELSAMLKDEQGLELAATNGPELCVISGDERRIKEFQSILEKQGYRNKILATSHAFHSAMMDPILKEYEKVMEMATIHPPKIPFISNVTGKVATPEEITNPKYWVRQIRQKVRFADGIDEILARKDVVFIETGPGNTLSTFVLSNPKLTERNKVVNLVRPRREADHDLHYLLSGIGKLWVNGLMPDWNAFHEGEHRRRVPLPTYSFDKIKYPAHTGSVPDTHRAGRADSPDKNPDISTWCYYPGWRLSPVIALGSSTQLRKCTLIFTDKHGLGTALSEKFRENDDKVVVVGCGSFFLKDSSHAFFVNPGAENDFQKLYEHLFRDGLLPDRTIHCWGISEQQEEPLADQLFEDRCNQYYFSVIHQIKAAQRYEAVLGKQLIVLSNGLHGILDSERIDPLKALALSLLRVVAREYPSMVTQHIDVSLSEIRDKDLLSALYEEMIKDRPGSVVSFRHSRRWEPTYDRAQTSGQIGDTSFKQNGVYLITGGLGAIGSTVATRLIRDYNAKVVLLGRTEIGAQPYLISDKRREKIDRFRELEKESENVCYIRCNIANEHELAEAVDLSEKRFGAICGVIHAAGVLEGESINLLQDLKEADYFAQFEPKVKALNSLRMVFEHKTLDFCLLTSSLASILGGLGFAAYAAVNGYMDYFVRSFKDKGELTNWISVDLDLLNFKSGRTNHTDKDEIFEVIRHSLSFKSIPQLVISTTDLSDRLKKRDEVQTIASAGPDEEWPFKGKIGSRAVSRVSKPGETEILAMWRKFFGDPELEAEDDFFEIGGDSLKALTMIGRIKSQFNVELKVKALFEHTSVRSLCAHILGLTNNHENGEGSLIVPKAELKELYTLSPAQVRCLFLHEFDKTSLAYNLPAIFLLTGELDETKLNSVFEKLIDRHESLRTFFPSIKGRRSQRIAEHADFEMEYLDAGSGDIHSIFHSFVRPFDLRSGPLIRVGLAEIGPVKHFLLIDMHHIVTDGVSEGVLMKDFMAIYKNEELPVLQLQYKDYAEWQQSDMQQKRLAVHKEFWLNEFAEELIIPDLPGDFPRPEVLNFNGDSVDFELNAGSVLKLKAIAEEEGTTLFAVLLSVLNILLSKLSNQEDIIIGTPVANRGHTDLEKMIGMFVNTLAIRNFPKAEMSYKEFLSEVRSKTLACFDNQSYPYENLVEELRIERDTSRNALFNVVFVLYNTESVNFSIPGLTLEQSYIPRKTSKFDITLSARESGGDLLLNFEYATSLFKKETIDRFIGYFGKIVSAVCADIHTKIGDIDMLSEKEKHRLLREFNDTRVDYPGDKTVVGLFEEQVGRTPRKVAVVSGPVELSYEELNERANRLARYLRERYGVGREILVCLCLERNEHMLIGMLAVLKAGGAYVPMDPGYPDDRIGYMVSDTGTRVVLTSEDHKDRLKKTLAGQEVGIETIDGAVGEERLRGYEGTNPQPNSGPDDLAYVIYTSGTTGRPKGVMLQHRGIVNLALAQGLEYGLEIKGGTVLHQNCLAYANYVFDAHVWEIYTTLIHGHSLHIIDKNLRTDISLLQEYIRKNAIAVATVPPALLDLDHILEVKTLIVAGEITPSRIMERYVKRNINIINAYGPTEATVCSTFHRYRLGDSNRNIGGPLSNMSVYVLDREGRPLPMGAIGELYIGGVGLARGYWNNEALTRERFVNNRFAEEADLAMGYAHLYRTGDLVRWLAGGNLEYLGRSDFQVKIRGYRIELGEIESQLSTYPGLRQAVVTVGSRASGDKYLIGYYVSDHELSAVEIRDDLQKKLPEYMVPSFFVHLKELPLTINGKLDMKALPEFKMTATNEENAPANEIENSLVDIWAEILNVDRQVVGTKKSFFELGGDSLKIVRLNSVINEKFNCTLSIPDLFRYSSITSLAFRINNAQPVLDNGVDEAAEETSEMKSVIGSLFND